MIKLRKEKSMTIETTLFASEGYIEYATGDVDRSMTIAAIYVAQSTSAQDYMKNRLPLRMPMRRDILTFLMTQSAVNHWVNTKKRFEVCLSNKKWLELTVEGLNEISASYESNRKNCASPEEVKEWIDNMQSGTGNTTESEVFSGLLTMGLDGDNEFRTIGQVTQAMTEYYMANKTSLPATIVSKREKIIQRLMGGMSPGEAFDT